MTDIKSLGTVRPPMRVPPRPPMPAAARPAVVAPRPALKMPARYFKPAPGQKKKDGTVYEAADCQADLVLLDRTVVPYYGLEHNFQDEQGRWSCFEHCPDEFEVGCPICAKGNIPYMAMFLTCLEVSTEIFRMADGREVTSHYRQKTLVVKKQQHQYFEDLASEHGEYRGITLHSQRDSDKDPKIGALEFVAKYSEDELIEAFGNKAFVKDGEVKRIENEKIQPFDYAAFFPKPSVAMLIQRYGGTPVPGSKLESDMASLDDAFEGVNELFPNPATSVGNKVETPVYDADSIPF